MRTEPGGDGAEGPLESSQPIIARQAAAAATAALAGPLNPALLRISFGDTLEDILCLENAARHDSHAHHHQERQDVLEAPRHAPPLYAGGRRVPHGSLTVRQV